MATAAALAGSSYQTGDGASKRMRKFANPQSWLIYHTRRSFALCTRRCGKCKESLGETTTSPVANEEYNNGSMGRPTGWGRRPHLIQYLLQMIGEAAEEYYRKIGFPENAGIDGTEVAS